MLLMIAFPESVKVLWTQYFNLFSLSFNQHCQLTVCTMGYVIPYHVNRIYQNFKVGFGITSMQGKESKHSAIKQELRSNTNRSTAQDHTGKCHQIANYVRKFYLQFHFPISIYHSHYRQRKALSDVGIADCACLTGMSNMFWQCRCYGLCWTSKADRKYFWQNLPTQMHKPYWSVRRSIRYPHWYAPPYCGLKERSVSCTKKDDCPCIEGGTCQIWYEHYRYKNPSTKTISRQINCNLAFILS